MEPFAPEGFTFGGTSSIVVGSDERNIRFAKRGETGAT